MTPDEILGSAVEIIRRRMPAGIKCRVFLFGSRATGRATERSDYDIGIEAETALSPGVIFAIEEDLDRLPDLHTVEVVDFHRVSEAFRRVAKEKIRVLSE